MTKNSKNRRTLTELASNPDFISGVYNYCDRWCERCPLTSRCLVYASEQENYRTLESDDVANEEFWRRLGTVFEDARQTIAEWAKAAGVDLTEPLVEKRAAHRPRRLRADNHPLAKAGKKYANAASDWFCDLNEGENPQKNAVEVSEATEVVHWYQYQIAVKTMRALSSRGDEPEEEAGPKDSDGSAKVALIGIDRSISAWCWLQTIVAERADSIIPLILQLERLRIAIEREFPVARTFVRPGFDEVLDQTN